MANKKVSVTGLVKEILRSADQMEVRDKLCALRRDEELTDEDYFRIFSLVTINVMTKDRQQAPSVNGGRDHLSAVASWFRKNGWVFNTTQDSLQSGFAGKNHNFDLFVIRLRKSPCLVFLVPSIVKVPEQSRQRVLDGIARLNTEVQLGAFQFDVESSQVSFRIGFPLPGESSINDEQIRDCFIMCCLTVDEAFPKIAKACWA